METVGGFGWWERAILFLILAAVVSFLLPTSADPDLWGHVRFGLDILESGSLDEYDPYAYTSAQRWINHEWMAEVTFGAMYRALGSAGLVLLKFVVSFLIVGLLFNRLRTAGLDVLRSGILVFLAVLLLTAGLVTVRPHLFTYLFLTLLLLLLDQSEGRRPKAIWLVPVLVAVWINFHGGVLAGVGVMGIWIVGRWATVISAQREERALRRGQAVQATGVGLAAAAALLLNPYGWRLPNFLIRTATVPRPDIAEWLPTEILSAKGAVYLGFVALCVASLRMSRAEKSLPALLAWCAFLILPLTAERHLPLFAIGSLILLAPHFASAAAAVPRRSLDVRATHRMRGALIVVCFALGLLIIADASPRIRCAQIDPERGALYPVRAVAWLAESGLEGNVATYFDWGEYALWHLQPRMLVSMDGRRETVYPDSIYEEYLRFQNGLGEWDGHIENRPTDLVLFSKFRPTYNLMQLKPGWEILYEDSLAAVFAPANSALGAQLRATPIPDVPLHGAGLCAP